MASLSERAGWVPGLCHERRRLLTLGGQRRQPADVPRADHGHSPRPLAQMDRRSSGGIGAAGGNVGRLRTISWLWLLPGDGVVVRARRGENFSPRRTPQTIVT